MSRERRETTIVPNSSLLTSMPFFELMSRRSINYRKDTHGRLLMDSNSVFNASRKENLGPVA